MQFEVLTLFPEIFSGYLTQSLLHKAIQKGLVSVRLHNLRDWAEGRHQQVDDRPYGGGPGMVLMVEPVIKAVEAVQALSVPIGAETEGRAVLPPAEVILLTPSGERLNQRMVEELAVLPRMLLLCGRYEGFDQRVMDLLRPREVSIGDYVLNGGEVAAMVLIDSLVRMVPGVLGDEQSSIEDSFSRGNRMLEYPQYSRPREFRGLSVPEVLLGGNHSEIARWRQEQSLERTRERRRDLLDSERLASD
ncbi:MAG: tRNA (guanosine(37)-N1)-methyltransferase TrmD [Planctomycetota bacterium]|jgi:tRNA (guanine37-N1)-methyltransferase|nr:tRNA (guanosine(37)-N1)-methyltransferase TrmD [Blastopirellula sp.]